MDKGVATFPVTVGIADLTNTYVDLGHVGGLSLTAGSTKVTLVNFQIEALPATVAHGCSCSADHREPRAKRCIEATAFLLCVRPQLFAVGINRNKERDAADWQEIKLALPCHFDR